MTEQKKTLGLLKNKKSQKKHFQCCTLARYVANHVSCHSPITMTKQKKTLGLIKKQKNRRKNTSNVANLPGMSPTMSLVIGIIIGSFTAMILIVIIVLKVTFMSSYLVKSSLVSLNKQKSLWNNNLFLLLLQWNCCLFFVSFFTKKHKKVCGCLFCTVVC